MNSRIRFGWSYAAVALVLFLLGAGNAFAQATASGTIQGTVFDQSQAIVIGAEVVVTNKATGEKRTASTNNEGNYRFDLLSASGYTVRVTRQGFAATVQNVDLLVGQTTTANLTLTPGATTEVVEVTAAAALVDLGKSGVSANITPTEVEDLPMIGRDVANLAYLAPGVKAADSYDPTKNRYAILSVNGAGGRNVNVTVNGIDNKDNTVGGPVMQLPLEAVQEFQISTQRFSAENGRSEGAAINMITKQGTNTYHGSVFGYFRNSALDTDEKDPNGTGGWTAEHPDYSRQQFGGSAGGALKKDKLFGFFAIERERESQALEETGTSYSELVLAKSAGFADQPATSIPRPFYETRYSARMDWTINSKNSAYVSYNSQANNSLNDQSTGTADLTNGNFTTNKLQLANATWNSLLSSNTVNTFTAGYQYWNNLIASNISAPLVTFPDAQFGTNTNVPQQSWQKKWQFRDDLSKTIGKHTLKLGADVIHTPQQGGFFEFSSTLEIDFAADPSVILNDAKDYPQKFATPGAVTGMAVANGNPYFLVSTNQVGLYFQDDWKVSSRLMVNLGVRWDKDYNFIGLSDVKSSRTYQELVALNSPVSNPYVSKVPHDDNKDFSPRVGFAYDLTGKAQHVLRGGFGLYYGNVFQNIPLFMEQMSNPTVFQTAISLSAPTDIVTGTGIALGNWRYGIDPMPVIPAPSSQLAAGSVGRLMDPNYRNPATEEFNVGYSYSPNRNTVIETEYTHVLGLHENKTMNIDQKTVVNGVCCTRPLDPYFANSTQPELASVRDEQSIGRSHYDGVNFTFRQRMTHHFSIDANYTLAWSYSYDSGGTSFRNYPRLESNPFASYEWGPNPNDERHHVTISGIIDLPKGFQLAPIMQFGSARPFNLTNSANTLNTGGGTAIAVVVPTANPTNWLAYSGNNTGAQNCFYGINGVAQGCTIAAYDPLRGDPFFQLDMRLAKNIRIRERATVQFVAQAFNLTNRANYGNDFNNNIASPTTFDHPAGFLNPSSTVIPRSLWGEFGVRFTF
jgi:Carboxypeptidase regulatory-like domain/TonB dependent receptor